MEDKLNPEEIKKKALTNLNSLFKETATYFNFDYKILIYRLMKSGYIKVTQLSETSGLSEVTLYKIVDDVEKYLNG